MRRDVLHPASGRGVPAAAEGAVMWRALIVAALGPVVSAAGVLWTAGRELFMDPALTWRTLVFTPAHQLIVAGVIISAFCVPAARDMLREGADLSLPEPEPSPLPEVAGRVRGA